MVQEAGRTAVCVQGFVYDATATNCVCGGDTVETLTGGSCAASCGDNEQASDGRCVCADGAVLNSGKCVMRSDCSRIFENDNGTWECLQAETCKQADMRQSMTAEKTCVATCDLYYEDKDEDEYKCVEKCPHWWYRTEDDGRCKEQKWKKNTAIAVPVVVIIVIIVIVVFVAVKKCGKEKHSEG